MKPIKLWYLLVGFLLLMPLFSCGSNPGYKTNSQLSQYSGEGESGIGGTGILANSSGIGGTGIIGEITGFGSIFVNGVEVEVDSKTKLYVDGKKVKQHHFARGEVVVLRTEKNNKLNVGKEIYIRHEVVGKVEKISSHKKSFIILGQRIDGKSLSSLPKVGKHIRVSGFRDNTGTIHARYISESRGYEQNMIRGKLKMENNKWYIGEQEITAPKSSQIKVGSVVRIRGALKNKVFQVQSLERLTRLPFSQPVKNILIQGFIQKSGAQQYNIADYGFTIRSKKQPLVKKVEAIMYLQKMNRHAWRLEKVLNKQRLPVGAAFPAMLQNRIQQPVRPMVSPQPFSMPNRFFR